MIYVQDHEPKHTHVKKAGREAVINLGDETTKPWVRENKGMNERNRRRALQIAGEYQHYLIEKWREIHGDS
ncbi:MAG: DUF4160 domain-containing protein [Blastocatellia bacterium]